MKKLTKEEQAARLLAIEAKWTPRGEKAGEVTHNVVVASAQHVQAAAYTALVVGKGYASKLRA